MELFDKKQREAIKRGIGHCTACGEYLKALREMGVPNETLEAQNEFNQKTLSKALELEEEFRKSNK